MEKRYIERVELHCHSKFSKGEGVDSPEEILRYAELMGMKAVAITDIGEVLAFPEMEWLNQRGRQHVRFIYGMEAYIADDLFFENQGGISNPEDVRKFCLNNYRATILVKDENGKKNLYKLITSSHTDFYDGVPRITYSQLLAHREGLLIGIGGLKSQLLGLINDYIQREEVLDFMKAFDFIEILPISSIKADSFWLDTEAKIRDFIEQIIGMADELGITVVATSNSFYLKPEDRIDRQNLLSAEEKRGNSEADLHFRTTQEMLEEFSFLGEVKAYEIVVENTNKLAEICGSIQITPSEKHYPCIEDAETRLKDICEAALTQKYNCKELLVAEERFKWEFEIIIQTGMAFLFLLLYELMEEEGFREYDISSSGIWAGSIIGYLIGISEIDPLKYKLNPKTVYGIKGNKEIDIDIIVPASLQDETLKMVEKLDGVGKTLCARTEHYFADKCINDFGTCGERWGEVILIPKGFDIEEITPIDYQRDENGNPLFAISYFDYCYLDSSLYKLDIIGHTTLDYLMKLSQMTAIELSKIPLEPPVVMDIFNPNKRIHDSIGCDDLPELGTEFAQELISKLHPESFDDFTKIISLCHSTGAWKENGEILVDNGIATIRELICCREDVEAYCLSLGIDRDTSYKIMEAIGKGHIYDGNCKDWIDWKNILLEKGAPEWYICSCEKIRYLFPRSHCISCLIITLRLAWFKIYYPNEFREVVGSVFG